MITWPHHQHVQQALRLAYGLDPQDAAIWVSRYWQREASPEELEYLREHISTAVRLYREFRAHIRGACIRRVGLS